MQGAVSGNVNFDGSGNVTIITTQANIAVVRGNITMTNGEGTLDNINLPAGFTSDNCTVLSAMFHRVFRF